MMPHGAYELFQPVLTQTPTNDFPYIGEDEIKACSRILRFSILVRYRRRGKHVERLDLLGIMRDKYRPPIASTDLSSDVFFMFKL